MKKGRVILAWKGGEVFIEYDDLEEMITFSNSNGIGFTASSIKDMERIVKGTESAIKEFNANITDIKDMVAEKAPALLGYDDYTSTQVVKQAEIDKNADKILSKMKAYTSGGKEDDAI
jgi:hypothetical protein